MRVPRISLVCSPGCVEEDGMRGTRIPRVSTLVCVCV